MKAIVEPGETTYCYFINAEESNVVVTKFKDLYLDGEYNEEPQEGQLAGDPVLNGWDVALSQNIANYAEGPAPTKEVASGVTGADGNNDGEYVFEDIKFGMYNLSETLQEGWANSNIYCDETFNPELEQLSSLLQKVIADDATDDPTAPIFVAPGQTLNCYIGNHPDSVLGIDKENNQTLPSLAGEVIEYTLEISVPDTSNTVFGVVATDTPPAGFTYTGTYTATSNVVGHDVQADIASAGGPGYDGTTLKFSVGDMLPGEIVTITYELEIGLNVVAGDYINTVIANGISNPLDEDSEIVSNEDQSSVEVFTPRVLGAQSPPRVLGAQSPPVDILPTTGNKLMDALLLPLLAGIGFYAISRRRELKNL